MCYLKFIWTGTLSKTIIRKRTYCYTEQLQIDKSCVYSIGGSTEFSGKQQNIGIHIGIESGMKVGCELGLKLGCELLQN